MEKRRNVRQRKTRLRVSSQQLIIRWKREKTPYTIVAVILPYGDRNLKRQKCVGTSFNDKGELVRVELVGPATYEIWLVSYNILANALLMFGVVE